MGVPPGEAAKRDVESAAQTQGGAPHGTSKSATGLVEEVTCHVGDVSCVTRACGHAGGHAGVCHVTMAMRERVRGRSTRSS